jgi:Domain of Unknown Function (DUF1080)
MRSFLAFSRVFGVCAAAALCLVSLRAEPPKKDAPPVPKDQMTRLDDGASLKGWHVSAKSGHSGTSKNKSGGKWEVVDGAITGSQDIPGNGGLVLTDEQFGDFEVRIEMRNDYGPDSGLFLRSTERGQAYQAMIDYHDNGNLMGVYGEGLSGGIHRRNFSFKGPVTSIVVDQKADFKAPFDAKQWPELWKADEWNELRARIIGNPPTVTTWINGVKTMEFTDTEKRHPDKGSIGLQVHGGGDYTKQFVRYRDIRVKKFD